MTPNNQIAAASVALASLIVASTTAGSVAQKPVYTPAATQSCLTALPNAVGGVPANDAARTAEALHLLARARGRFDMGSWAATTAGA